MDPFDHQRALFIQQLLRIYEMDPTLAHVVNEFTTRFIQERNSPTPHFPNPPQALQRLTQRFITFLENDNSLTNHLAMIQRLRTHQAARQSIVDLSMLALHQQPTIQMNEDNDQVREAQLLIEAIPDQQYVINTRRALLSIYFYRLMDEYQQANQQLTVGAFNTQRRNMGRRLGLIARAEGRGGEGHLAYGERLYRLIQALGGNPSIVFFPNIFSSNAVRLLSMVNFNRVENEFITNREWIEERLRDIETVVNDMLDQV